MRFLPQLINYLEYSLKAIATPIQTYSCDIKNHTHIRFIRCELLRKLFAKQWILLQVRTFTLAIWSTIYKD